MDENEPYVADGWEDYIRITEEWLTHYPASIFTGVSGDPGALFVVDIRKAIEKLNERTAG